MIVDTKKNPEEKRFYEEICRVISLFKRSEITDVQIYGILQLIDNKEIENREE